MTQPTKADKAALEALQVLSWGHRPAGRLLTLGKRSRRHRGPLLAALADFEEGQNRPPPAARVDG